MKDFRIFLPFSGKQSLTFLCFMHRMLANCADEISIGSRSTVHTTHSVNGGVVNEPRYVQKSRDSTVTSTVGVRWSDMLTGQQSVEIVAGGGQRARLALLLDAGEFGDDAVQGVIVGSGYFTEEYAKYSESVTMLDGLF